MGYNLKDKVVVITGASSGIGKAIAITLVQCRAKVVLGARREERLIALVDQLSKEGGEASFLIMDVTKRSDLNDLVDLAVKKYGRLDAIVNNAGVANISRIDELDVEGWEAMIDVNLKGVLYGMAASIAVFKKQGAGHIVNVISTSGIKIVPTQGVYAATKNAVRTLGEAFRQESDGKIRITGVSPGFVNTELVNVGGNKEIQEMMDKIAIKPEAIAETVAFALAQPKDVEVGDLVVRPAVQN